MLSHHRVQTLVTENPGQRQRVVEKKHATFESTLVVGVRL
jgi:hypothetical protein